MKFKTSLFIFWIKKDGGPIFTLQKKRSKIILVLVLMFLYAYIYHIDSFTQIY
jgi:hypothetical protein